MAYLPEGDPGKGFAPFAAFEKSLGFVPNLFRAQTLLPAVVEAEARIAARILFQQSALSRIQKERILLLVAADAGNTYCVTAHWKMLERLGVPASEPARVIADHHKADLPAAEVALLDFCLKLARHPSWIQDEDIRRLRETGHDDEEILEAVLTTALTRYMCCLSTGLGVVPDFEPPRYKRKGNGGARLRSGGPSDPDGVAGRTAGSPGYIKCLDLSADSFPPFAFFREQFGFVPRIFQAQTLRPDVVEAEAGMVGTVLLGSDPLDRVRKEFILLVISAANLNTYCVAVHCEMLRNLGIPQERSDQIALDHRLADLPAADAALLDAALKLATRPAEWGEADIASLRTHGFTDPQILDAVVMTSLTSFLNTVQMGLGTHADFEPRLKFPRETPLPAGFPATKGGAEPSKATGAVQAPLPADEDLALVGRARGGDLEAFESLVARNKGRIYQTILGITGRPEDAEDGTQEALVKAYQHLGEFQGTSRFSTWLTRIAINEALMILRRRKNLVSLDEEAPDEDEGYRPRQLQAWDDSPEEMASRDEIRRLVEAEMMKLPERYRAVVVLRDLAGLSTEEAAKALGLGIPALKTRLFRGHMMLREALTPHFGRRGTGDPGA